MRTGHGNKVLQGEAAPSLGPVSSAQNLIPGTNAKGEFWSPDSESVHQSEACYLPLLVWVGMLLASLHQPQLC